MEATGRPSLREEDHFLDRPCANCKKPNSKAYCRRCNVTDVGKLRVFYCSPACQADHWDTHRETCKGIRQLSRAVSFMAELWTMFEADYCPVTAKFVSEHKGVVEMAALGQGEDPRPWMGKSVLESVLVGPVPGHMKRTVQAAIFGMQHCSPLSVTAEPILEFVFGDFCTLLEAQIEVKDPALVVRFCGKYFSHHFILIATLKKTGEQFAIDFEGIKHGWKELLYPESVYFKHRATGDIQWSPLGGKKQAQADLLGRVEWDSDKKAVIDFGDHGVKFLFPGLMSIMVLEGTSMGDLFASPQEKFAVTRELLMAKGHLVLDYVKGVMNKSGMPRTYYDEQWRLHVTIKEELSIQYETVWLTKEEYEKKKVNKHALMAMFMKRLANVPEAQMPQDSVAMIDGLE